MRKVAIRKALPHIDETDVDIGDIKAIRMLPSTHLPTVSKPLPWNTAQSSIDWENRIREERDKGNLERIPLPTSELGGIGAEGTWVSPALQEAFATPDVTINPQVASTIVGILNGVPNWWRTPRQGARAGGVGEGFHFGGFPQESFVRLTDTDINPRSIEHALNPLAAETPFRDRVRNLVSQFPSYQDEGVSPEQAASLVWGKQPTNLTVNPLLQDKSGGAIKIASEPMDIAMRLLKQSLELQPPMTQGVEEQAPMQEDIPMIDMQTIQNNDPCSCAETVRTEILSDYQKYLNGIIEDEDEDGPNWIFGEENDPQYETPHKHEALKYMQSLIEEVENASCEEIMEYELYDEMCDNAGFSEADQMKYTGEPMDIAFQLLKEDIDYQDEDYIHPHEQIWNDEADKQLLDTTNSLWDYVENMSNDDKLAFLNNQGNYFMNMAFQNHFPTTQEEIDRAVAEMMFDAWQDAQLEMPGGIDFDFGGNRKSGEPRNSVRAYAVHPSQWKKLASEPMDIALQLLKERVSPEAKRHKLEYDKKYESSPERIKYREQLNQERRKRGIYGSHDHKDISHTEGGKLTLEGEHENRARHFKDKGTLREL